MSFRRSGDVEIKFRAIFVRIAGKLSVIAPSGAKYHGSGGHAQRTAVNQTRP